MEPLSLSSLLQFLNQGWVSIPIGALVGLASGYYFYRKAIRKPRPVMRMRRVEVFNPDPEHAQNEDIQILYKGNQVRYLFQYTVWFWNAGNEVLHGTAIAQADPLRLSFPEGSRILRHSISATTNPANDVRLSMSEGTSKSIDFSFGYLNPSDGVSIAIWSDSPNPPEVTGSLIGLPKGIEIPECVVDLGLWSFLRIRKLRAVAIMTIVLLVGNLIALIMGLLSPTPEAPEAEYFLKYYLFPWCLVIIITLAATRIKDIGPPPMTLQ